MIDAHETPRTSGRENEADFQLLFYRSLCPMWVYDAESLAFLAINDAAIQRCGWSREELLQKTVADVCPAEDLPFLRESGDLSASGGPTKQFSWRYPTTNGDLVSLPCTRRKIDFDGKVGILVAAADGLPRLEPEGAPQSLVDADSAADAIIIRDLEHRLLFWNQGAERLYGWSAVEAIGAKAGDLFKNDTEHFALAASELLAQSSWTAEIERRRKDGERVVVKSRWSLIRDAERRPVSILIVETNFTEAKKLQWQFLRAQRLEATGALAGGIAHDLNNILAPVMMSVGLLRRATEDSAAQRMLSIIEASAERGARIVKQVFTFARGIDGEPVLLQPKHLLGDLAKIMAQTFPRNIDIQTDFPSELSTVIGDATQIHQLLLNLCVNAREAMPSGGTLTVGAENLHVDEHFARMNPGARLGPHVLLRISDTGVGISSDTLAKIFDPFVTTKKPGQGSGLGLAAVMRIVKSHGGFVTVHTELGAGSTFKIFLPATKDAAAFEARDDVAVAGGKGELVLVVDDETLIREALVSTLQANGYRAFTAEDGTDALALYFQRGAEIDVVLTDLSMGQMDGITLVRQLRRLNGGVRVIVSSAQLQKDNLAILSGLGVKRFLHKPYSANQLLRTLQAALGDAAAKRKQ